MALEAFKALGLNPANYRTEFGAVADILHQTVTGGRDDRIFEACQTALVADDLVTNER